MAPQRSVLITGCSDGSLGSALAIAFHAKGLKVYATARNPEKLNECKAAGITTLILDVLSADSIREAVAQVPSLDILVNNAGAVYASPITDVNIAEARKLFDLNVWSYLEVTQAFLPLLLQSPHGPLVVNQTSVVSVAAIPFQSIYNASKAAMAMLSDNLRVEMRKAFNVRVVDLKTGQVSTNVIQNAVHPSLPQDSLWSPVRKEVEDLLKLANFDKSGMPADRWAKHVVQNLLKSNPPNQIWYGGSAWLVWLTSLFPSGWFDSTFRQATGLEKLTKPVQAANAARNA